MGIVGYSSSLYTLDPITGLSSEIYEFEPGIDIRGMTVLPGSDLVFASNPVRYSAVSIFELFRFNMKDEVLSKIGDLWTQEDGGPAPDSDSERIALRTAAQGLAVSPAGDLYGIVPTFRTESDILQGYQVTRIDIDDADMHLVGTHLASQGLLAQSLEFTPDGRLFALGHYDIWVNGVYDVINNISELNPVDGSLVGTIYHLEGPSVVSSFRGLTYIPEPTTIMLLLLGAVKLRRRNTP